MGDFSRGRFGFRIHGPGNHWAVRHRAGGSVHPAATRPAAARFLIELAVRIWRERLRHTDGRLPWTRLFALNSALSVDSGLDFAATPLTYQRFRPNALRESVMDRSWI